MKTAEETKKELVKQWIDKADEDLAVARYLLHAPDPHLYAAAFHAQQCAEKSLKALLVWNQIDFPKTHDIGKLLDLLMTVDKQRADSLRQLVILNDYSVEIRYPSDSGPLSIDETKNAILLAGKASEVLAEVRKLASSG
jgi:HEPN domain-containing protein